MANNNPLPWIQTRKGLYRHCYKGMRYEVVATVRHSETLEPMALKRALCGENGLWVRLAAMSRIAQPLAFL